MTSTTPDTETKFDHSIFEADIHGQSMNMVYLGRIFSWIGPHKALAAYSVCLVILASLLAVLLPVIISRVVVDGIIVGDANMTLPDFGMIDLNLWLASFTGLSPIISACVIYGAFTLICHTLYHFHRITFARTVLHSLRDMRLDLFAHMEHRPSSFYDKVAVGRIMTRITNDVQALFELLMGLGMLIGEFVPFFIALFIMLAMDVQLTMYLLVAIPIFGVVTYFF
ncbi:MAG: ATP-binding cassette subfamily B multidrug efflux pump, partial [Candidatus Pseudothioglobus sp.]